MTNLPAPDAMPDLRSPLELLRRLTLNMAAGKSFAEVLQTITDGLVSDAGCATAVVSLFVHDHECAHCLAHPPEQRSEERRLHQFALSRDATYEFSGVHIVPLGRFFAGRAALAGQALRFDDVLASLDAFAGEQPPEDAAPLRELRQLFHRLRVHSGIAYPMRLQDELVGTLTVLSRRDFTDAEADLLEVFAQQAALVVHGAQMQQDLEAARERLAGENAYLLQEADVAVGGMVAASPSVRGVLKLVRQVAGTNATVLITGETGTGKEVIARAIHAASARAGQPLVKLNCGAIAPTLVESELFGHERGAFTGATQRRLGRFELAHRGTLLLDEIGELPLEMQTRLLRVLQEREIERVGGERAIAVDVRVIASTHRDLERDVATGRFREDLFYRLNVLPIHVPPLRERREDIPILAAHFIAQFAGRSQKPLTGLSPDSVRRIVEYPWPGNVRELQNVIERACVLSPGPVVEVPALTSADRGPAVRQAGDRSLRAAQRAHVAQVLRDTGGRIEGDDGAAAILGLRPSTLRSLMQRLGIPRQLPPA